MTELTPKHFVCDGIDSWECDNCGRVRRNDQLVVDHPVKKHAVLCLSCGENWLNDNPISPEPLNIGQVNRDTKPFVVMAGTGLISP